MALTPRGLVPSSSPVSARQGCTPGPVNRAPHHAAHGRFNGGGRSPWAGLTEETTAPVGRFNGGDHCSYRQARPSSAQDLPGGLWRFFGPSATDRSGSSSVRSPPGVSPKPDPPSDMKVLLPLFGEGLSLLLTCTQPPPLLPGGSDAAAGICSSVKPSSLVSYG